MGERGGRTFKNGGKLTLRLVENGNGRRREEAFQKWWEVGPKIGGRWELGKRGGGLSKMVGS